MAVWIRLFGSALRSLQLREKGKCTFGIFFFPAFMLPLFHFQLNFQGLIIFGFLWFCFSGFESATLIDLLLAGIFFMFDISGLVHHVHSKSKFDIFFGLFIVFVVFYCLGMFNLSFQRLKKINQLNYFIILLVW